MKSLKKVWTILTLALVLGVGPSEGLEGECGGALSETFFVCIMDVIDYFSSCTFPSHKLNPDCVLSSCPRLIGLNPLNGNGTVNQIGLNSVITVLNECMATAPTICGITIASLPMVQLGWTLDQVLPTNLHINGSCTLNPQGGSTTNDNQAVFSLPPQHNPDGTLTLSALAPNIYVTSHWNCSVYISTALLDLLQPVHIQLFNFPDMLSKINISVNPTLSIDFGTNPPSFKIQRDNTSISILTTNYVGCGFKLPQILEDLINLSYNKFFTDSTTTMHASNFLSTLATHTVNAAIQSCR